MEVVKLVANDLGMEIVEDFPSLGELDSYEAAFLTSTSRMVLPVAAIRTPSGRDKIFFYDQDAKAPKLNIIKELVKQKVIERATVFRNA